MTVRLWVPVAAVVLLSACGRSTPQQTATTTTPPPPPSSTSASTAAAPPTPTVQTKNWFDLAVGDCVTEIPAIDVGAVTTTLVDCAAPHQAEVFLLAPLAVNTAIDQVAMEKCSQGFVAYTGQAFVGSPFQVTYLIDSNQDRTANNPMPSTAICFLESRDGAALTKSARP
jgi:hypothetical protein